MPSTVSFADQYARQVGNLADRDQSLEPEEVMSAKVREILSRPSPWQQVIHGPTDNYRLRVALVLIEEARFKEAERFAYCGRGDQVGFAHEKFLIIPHRCGSRLCPRCARYRGGKYVMRVLEHLAKFPHEWLFHIVLTQPVIVGEGLVECRNRLAAKWKGLGDRRRYGLVNGLLTEHVKWSMKGGWHCHLHLFGEFQIEHDGQKLADAWLRVSNSQEGRSCQAPFVRGLAEPGERVVDVPREQGEFWEESTDHLTKALQYVVRDVCEGPATFAFGELEVPAFTELVQVMHRVKLHRMIGSWRKHEDDADAVTEDGSEVAATKEFMVVGTVDDLLFDLIGKGHWGTRFGLAMYERAGVNQSPYCVRLRGTLRQLGSIG